MWANVAEIATVWSTSKWVLIGFLLVQSETITTKVVYSINKIDHQDISVACLPKSRDHTTVYKAIKCMGESYII
jgi:hypothetical protein